MELFDGVFDVICSGWIRRGKVVGVASECVNVDGAMATHEGAESKCEKGDVGTSASFIDM